MIRFAPANSEFAIYEPISDWLEFLSLVTDQNPGVLTDLEMKMPETPLMEILIGLRNNNNLSWVHTIGDIQQPWYQLLGLQLK